MKDRELHLMLWQKRNELRINDDVQHDWLDMQAMLDVQMPVTPPSNGVGGSGSGAAGAAGLPGIKLLSILLVGLGVAALTYFVVKNTATKNRAAQKTTKMIRDSKSPIVSKAGNESQINPDSSNTSIIPSPPDNINRYAPANADKTPTGSQSSANAKTVSPAVNSGTTPGAMINAADKNRHALAGGGSANGRANNIAGNNKTNTAATGHGIKNRGFGSHTTRGKPAATYHHPTNNLIKRAGPGLLSNKIYYRGVTPSAKPARFSPGAILHRAGNEALHHNNIPARTWGRFAYPGNASANGKRRGGLSSRKGRNTLLGTASQRMVKGPGQQPGTVNPVSGSDSNSIAKKSDEQSTELAAMQAKFVSEQFQAPVLPPSLTDKFADQQNNSSPSKNTNTKTPGTKNSKLDWGLLTGVNSAGSFTGKSQNANFYGSFPVDLYFGLFATYNFSNKWGLGLGVRALNPQSVSGTYSHSNDSKKDTLQTLDMSDARKLYFVDIPLNLVFKPSQAISIKAGPVFSLPVKQANGISTFQTGKLKKDSLYYVGVTKTINATTYTPDLNIGLSAGIGFQTGRFIFDAAYVTGLKGITVGSALGSYTANNSSFLFSVSFKLNKK